MSTLARSPVSTYREVLVVGAGPVGLFTALLLSRRGLSVAVVERHPSPLLAPKAHALGPRTLEIFRQAGLDVERMRSLATRPEDAAWVRFTQSLAGREYGKVPYERQGDTMLDLTPTPLISLPQPVLEGLLSEQVAADPRIELRRGHCWQSVEQGGARCRSRITSDQGDYFLESRYVLACDGAASSVREALAIPMEGVARVQHSQNIHFLANLRPFVEERPAIIYWVVNRDVAGAFIAHDIDREWVFLRFDRPDEIPDRAMTNEEASAILRAAIGADACVDVQRASAWTVVAEVARHYRTGRVFLVGDAAHRFPPAGGLGLNTGIQDAHNLVWRLAAIHDDWAQETMLDMYETERRAVAVANTEQSLSNARSIPQLVAKLLEAAEYDGQPLPSALAEEVGAAIAQRQVTFDNLGLHLGFSYDPSKPLPPAPHIFVPRAEPGDRMPHCWIGDAALRQSNLDLVRYDRFTLFVCGADASMRDRFGQDHAPMNIVDASTVNGFPAEWLALVGLDRPGGLLVRPDGHIAARMAGAGANLHKQLEAALLRTLGRELDR